MKKIIGLTAIVAAVALTACSLGKKPVSERVTTSAVETVTETTVEVTEAVKEETSSEKTTISPFPGSEEETTVEAPAEAFDGGCKLMIASDIHYLAEEQTDFQDGFYYMIEHGDGKVVQYIWQVTDAFIEEVIREKPDLLILSGDLTLNGEKTGHMELAEKLQVIEEEGIPIVVIPGNHDINNSHAAYYEGVSRIKTASIGQEEFAQIYENYGYNEAISRDPASLSYTYQIDEYNRALMLDTCQYENGNRVGGVVRADTYDWIELQMEEAWELGMNVIPVGHHNLLDESEVYVEDCTIEHSEQLVQQLEAWQVPLFLSGHLHVQHFMQSDDEVGIYEIVTSSLATPPCQYGILYYGDDGSFRYHTRAVDMESWAKAQGGATEELLQFRSFGKRFLSKVFYNQAQDEFVKHESMRLLTDYQKEQMAKVYAELNSACYAGKVLEVKENETKKPGYKLWEEHGYPSILAQYLESIVRDGTRDYNRLEVE